LDSSFLVIGSGAGGATVAKELATRGAKVTIVEKGGSYRLGTALRALKFYSGGKLNAGEMSVEGTELLRTIMIGGSTMVTLGNGVRALQDELGNAGLHIDRELEEAEKELGVTPTPEKFLGERTRILRSASTDLGYEVKPMPKFVNFNRCRMCGLCVVGCPYGAKWTALNFIGEAKKAGAKLMTETEVEQIIHRNGEVKSIRARGPSGRFELAADKVILAAGGLGTPVILQNSGVDAGDGLFADLFAITYGIVDGLDMGEELGMATVIDEFHEKDGFILSPALDMRLDMLFYLPLLKKTRAFKRNKTLGLMTKIADENSGKVYPNGRIHKPVTERDRKRLEHGAEISKNILIQAGADHNSIFTTKVRGAHMGGTAAIGKITDKNLETEIGGVYVCDASVLPSAPGNPPALTIVAIAKKLAFHLLSEQTT